MTQLLYVRGGPSNRRETSLQTKATRLSPHECVSHVYEHCPSPLVVTWFARDAGDFIGSRVEHKPAIRIVGHAINFIIMHHCIAPFLITFFDIADVDTRN